MVKTITTIHRSEMLVDAKSIEHCTTEVNGLVRQDRQFAVGEPVKRVPNAGIEDGAIEHVRAVVRKEHLQACLNIRFGGLGPEGAPDQHQRAISDETSDLFFRQKRQVEFIANVINGCRQVFFRVDQRTVKIKDENRAHGGIIAS